MQPVENPFLLPLILLASTIVNSLYEINNTNLDISWLGFYLMKRRELSGVDSAGLSMNWPAKRETSWLTFASSRHPDQHPTNLANKQTVSQWRTQGFQLSLAFYFSSIGELAKNGNLWYKPNKVILKNVFHKLLNMLVSFLSFPFFIK